MSRRLSPSLSFLFKMSSRRAVITEKKKRKGKREKGGKKNPPSTSSPIMSANATGGGRKKEKKRSDSWRSFSITHLASEPRRAPPSAKRDEPPDYTFRLTCAPRSMPKREKEKKEEGGRPSRNFSFPDLIPDGPEKKRGKGERKREKPFLRRLLYITLC